LIDALKNFEKLAPFALKAGKAITGRPRLLQIQKHLHFMLVTTDITENSRRKLLEQFSCPIVECFTSADIERVLGMLNTKVVGFKRSSISINIYKGLRGFRINGKKKIEDIT